MALTNLANIRLLQACRKRCVSILCPAVDNIYAYLAHGFQKQEKQVIPPDTQGKFSRGCQKNKQNFEVSIFYRDDRNLPELQSFIPHQ